MRVIYGVIRVHAYLLSSTDAPSVQVVSRSYSDHVRSRTATHLPGLQPTGHSPSSTPRADGMSLSHCLTLAVSLSVESCDYAFVGTQSLRNTARVGAGLGGTSADAFAPDDMGSHPNRLAWRIFDEPNTQITVTVSHVWMMMTA